MTRIYWWLVDGLSRMLDPDEWDAVRGDLAESGEAGGRALRDVLGLVARRQAALWKAWPPWLILLGLVAPIGVLLSLGSRSMANGTALPIWMFLNTRTLAYVGFPEVRSEVLNAGAGIVTVYLILVCWSWASGFLIGSLSRLAVPAHGALFCLAVLIPGLWDQPNLVDRGPNTAVFSLPFYSVVFPLMVQAALVLLPAVRGMRQGLGLAAFPRPLRAILWACVAMTVAALVVMSFNWVLCSIGRFQACIEWETQAGAGFVWGDSPIVRIPTLPLALAGPVGYLAATAIWRRRRAKTVAA